jgi:uncharacterized protein HemX
LGRNANADRHITPTIGLRKELCVEDWTFFEKWLAALASGGAAVAVFARSMANVTARIDANEKDIKSLKDHHEQQLHDIHQSVKDLRTEMKTDVKELWNRSETRHDTILSKLDDIEKRLK